MNRAEKKAMSMLNKVFSFKVERKTIYDRTAVRCFKCYDTYDKEIGEFEVDAPCPRCGHPMKEPVLGYDPIY